MKLAILTGICRTEGCDTDICRAGDCYTSVYRTGHCVTEECGNVGLDLTGLWDCGTGNSSLDPALFLSLFLFHERHGSVLCIGGSRQ